MKDIQTQLEDLVDAVGLAQVVKGLMEVCYAKSMRIGVLQKDWEHNTQVLDNAYLDLSDNEDYSNPNTAHQTFNESKTDWHD